MPPFQPASPPPAPQHRSVSSLSGASVSEEAAAGAAEAAEAGAVAVQVTPVVHAAEEGHETFSEHSFVDEYAGECAGAGAAPTTLAHSADARTLPAGLPA